MALKMFLFYVIGFFGLSLGLWLTVKQLVSSVAQVKKPLFYGIIAAIIVSLIAFGLTYLTNDLYTIFWMFAVLFTVAGIVHVLILHKKYFTPKPGKYNETLAGEILFAFAVAALIIAAFSALEYFFVSKDFLFYPIMMSAIAFVVPLLVQHTFEAAFAIPKAVFHTWSYPSVPLDLPEEDGNEKLLVIGFEIEKRVGDGKKNYFRAKSPEAIVLGELYYHFINDYNEMQSETRIQYMDAENEPQLWWFRMKRKWYQAERILDPSATMRDNGVVENTVIICERV